MVTPIWLFAKALLKGWWAKMSCAAFTFLGIYAAAANKPNEWIVRGSIILGICFFAVAAYGVWRDEYQNGQDAAVEYETSLAGIRRDYDLACAQRETATTALKTLTAEFQSERHKAELKHPDVIIERNGNTATGTLSLYNRGSAEAFNVSINALSCHHGMVFWQTAARLAAGKTAAVRFTVSDSNGISSIQHDSVNLLAQMFHVVYPEHPSEEQLAKAFEPVKQWVSVDYFDVPTKTNWQTPCQFIYDRKTGELTVAPGEAVPTVAYPPIPDY